MYFQVKNTFKNNQYHDIKYYFLKNYFLKKKKHVSNILIFF